ncbi:MAG: DUF4347 domain-containing protein [Lentisphaeraceae bacterium]|nr:DUF4347 domain-containing protein [Lentisphaeraceae bacterium]
MNDDQKTVFEMLEPRILLSGSPAPAPTPEPVNIDVRLQEAQDVEQSIKEIAFVDSSIENTAELLEHLDSNIEVVFIDADDNGLDTITNTLSEKENISAIHIVSHGNNGRMALGDTTISSKNINLYQDQLSDWSKALTQNADILIYGCNVAQDQDFVAAMSLYTEADVAASNDLTGAKYLEGDAELEVHTGTIEAQTIINQADLDRANITLATIPTNVETYQNTTKIVTIEATGNEILTEVNVSGVTNGTITSDSLTDVGSGNYNWQGISELLFTEGQIEDYSGTQNADRTDYNITQDGTPVTVNGETGNEVEIYGNTWLSIDLNGYNITANTVVSFDYMSTLEPEIAAIGFEENNSWDSDSNRKSFFQFHGYQNFGHDSTETYTGAGAWQNITIKVGDLLESDRLENFTKLILANDDDDVNADGFKGNSFYKNFVIGESQISLEYTPEQDNLAGATLSTDVTSTTDGTVSSVSNQAINIAINATEDASVNATEEIEFSFAQSDFQVTNADNINSITISNISLNGGSLTYNGGTTVENGDTLSAAELDTLKFDPATNQNGNEAASFLFVIDDAVNGTIPAQMSINITNVNDAPEMALTGFSDNYYADWQLDENSTDIINSLTYANWDFSTNTAESTRNSGPSIFYSDFVMDTKNTYTGSMTINPATDDDMVGFVLGYSEDDINNSDGFMLIDWKKYFQNHSSMGDSPNGLRTTFVDGQGISNNDLWQRDQLGQNVLANNLGSSAYSHQDYLIDFVYSEDSLKVYVDSVLEFDLTPSDFGIDAFPSGSLGYYTFTQIDSGIRPSFTLNSLSGPDTLTSMNEDSTTNGSSISEIVSTSIYDVDPNSDVGIAITGIDNSNGTWQYNTGGSWADITAASETNALHLDADDRLRFIADTDFVGSSTVDFRAWDTTTGSSGSYLNIAATGGTTAYSSSSSSASIEVTQVNDAPNFNLGSDINLTEDSPAQTFNAFTTSMFEGHANESSQNLSFSLTTSNDNAFQVLPEVDANTGDLTFTMAQNFNGTVTVNLTLNDDGGTDNGGVDSITKSFDINVYPIADSPTLTVKNVEGTQTNNSLPLNISATAGASNEVLTLLIEGLPDGTTISGATQMASSWLVDGVNINNLTANVPIEWFGSKTITVTAISTDDSSVATLSKTFTLNIIPFVTPATTTTTQNIVPSLTQETSEGESLTNLEVLSSDQKNSFILGDPKSGNLSSIEVSSRTLEVIASIFHIDFKKADLSNPYLDKMKDTKSQNVYDLSELPEQEQQFIKDLIKQHSEQEKDENELDLEDDLSFHFEEQIDENLEEKKDRKNKHLTQFDLDNAITLEETLFGDFDCFEQTHANLERSS